jgi:hypothetical protein
MTNTERIVTWGLLGFVAYELYKCCNPALGAPGCNPPLSLPSSGESAPDWIGQLGQSIYGEDFNRPSCGLFGRCG